VKSYSIPEIVGERKLKVNPLVDRSYKPVLDTWRDCIGREIENGKPITF
jgi:hypothetical protein